jgi:hypothetical protein
MKSARKQSASTTLRAPERVYNFGLGNTSTGAIGANLTVVARTPDAALDRAKKMLRENLNGISLDEVVGHADGESFRVYVNPERLSVADIEDEYEYEAS